MMVLKTVFLYTVFGIVSGVKGNTLKLYNLKLNNILKSINMDKEKATTRKFTLDQPVTRQIISVETGIPPRTLYRLLKGMPFVKKGKMVYPATYKQILEELGFSYDVDEKF